MEILSVRQPWAWLIVNGLKDIENRSWSTRYRGPLLIHAGQRFESHELEGILNRLDAAERQRFPMDRSAFQHGGIIGIANLVDVVTDSQSKWFEGEGYYGWRLENARLLPFIPLRGSLGLLNVPPEIAERVQQACADTSL
ncbi:MAG TPA: ASCH domain-containing protein [Ktedonobacteraceae bacterium]|nr:ASCH domain-containing protein [Ktedonobacteraceae bacterium]